MKITYTESKKGIYYPTLALPTGTTYSIGKYGRVYLDYLKKYRRGTYTTLLTENRLNEQLHQVDIEAREMVLKITEKIAVSHGILRRRAKAHGAGRGSTKMHANFPSAGKCARSPSSVDKKARAS